MKKETLLFIPILLFVSCFSDDTPKSAKVKQSEIYQEYDLFLDYSAQEWKADARFRWRNEDGESMQLTPPSRVTINGQGMEWSENLFESNSYSRKGKTDAKRFTFQFADTDGRFYINTVPFTPIEFDTVTSTMPRFVDMRIPLSRDVLPDEVIYFNLTDTADIFSDEIMIAEKEKWSEVTYDPGTHCLVISKSFFEFVRDTELLLWMNGYRKMPVTSGTSAGGKMIVNFKSKPLRIVRR